MFKTNPEVKIKETRNRIWKVDESESFLTCLLQSPFHRYSAITILYRLKCCRKVDILSVWVSLAVHQGRSVLMLFKIVHFSLFNTRNQVRRRGSLLQVVCISLPFPIQEACIWWMKYSLQTAVVSLSKTYSLVIISTKGLHLATLAFLILCLQMCWMISLGGSIDCSCLYITGWPWWGISGFHYFLEISRAGMQRLGRTQHGKPGFKNSSKKHPKTQEGKQYSWKKLYHVGLGASLAVCLTSSSNWLWDLDFFFSSDRRH